MIVTPQIMDRIAAETHIFRSMKKYDSEFGGRWTVCDRCRQAWPPRLGPGYVEPCPAAEWGK